MVKEAIEDWANIEGFEVRVYAGKGEYFEVGSRDQGSLFAFLLRRQRQMQGLSLADVANRLGLKSRNAYARYEQGKATPTVEKLAQLLKAVNPDHDFILRQTA
jgi:predicted transcriptional regulator